MKKRITKTGQVKEHLMKYGSISTWEAITKYKATRLSHFIYMFKKQGLDISTETVKSKDINGNTVRFAVYHLNKTPDLETSSFAAQS